MIGAVQRALGSRRIAGLRRRAACRANCTSSGRRARPAAITCEYGYSTAWATRSPAGSASSWRSPTREVVVMVGDGSYMMMNSEIATSVMLGEKLTIVVLDNRGFGCINRLQMATGGANFNNLLDDTRHEVLPEIDFAAHAQEPGRGRARRWRRSPSWRRALKKAKSNTRTTVIVIDTDPLNTRPRPAATGGMWRCRKSRRASRGARARARNYEAERREAKATHRQSNMRDRSETHDNPHRRQPHRLVERRHAGDRRQIRWSNA